MICRFLPRQALTLAVVACIPVLAHAQPAKFFEAHCYSCHEGRNSKGNLDLSSLKAEPSNPDNFARWLKIHDRIDSGEMPPKTKDRPPAAESAATLKTLHDMLVKAEQARLQGQ